MANYTILHQLVSGLQTNVAAVTMIPNTLLTDTATGKEANYYLQGDVVSDTNLGGAGAVTRLLSFGAIA